MFWHHYLYLCLVFGRAETIVVMTTMCTLPESQKLISLLFLYCSHIEQILTKELCYFNFIAQKKRQMDVSFSWSILPAKWIIPVSEICSREVSSWVKENKMVMFDQWGLKYLSLASLVGCKNVRHFLGRQLLWFIKNLSSNMNFVVFLFIRVYWVVISIQWWHQPMTLRSLKHCLMTLIPLAVARCEKIK